MSVSQQSLPESVLAALPRALSVRAALMVGTLVAVAGYGASAFILPEGWRTSPNGLHPVAWVGHGVAAGLLFLFGHTALRSRAFQAATVGSASNESNGILALWYDDNAPTTLEERLNSLRVAAERWRRAIRFQWNVAATFAVMVPVIVSLDGALDWFDDLAADSVFWSFYVGLALGSLEFLLIWLLAVYAQQAWLTAVPEWCDQLLRAEQEKVDEEQQQRREEQQRQEADLARRKDELQPSPEKVPVEPGVDDKPNDYMARLEEIGR